MAWVGRCGHCRLAILIIGVVFVAASSGCAGGLGPTPAPSVEHSATPTPVEAQLAERVARHLTMNERYRLAVP